MPEIKNTRQRPPGGIKAWSIWCIGAIFYLYEYFVRAAPNVMEVELAQTFQVSAGTLGGALGAYYYIYAPMQIVVGLMLDRWGGRRLLVPAVLLVAIGSLIECVAQGMTLLAFARFIQGLGSAFAFVGAVYLATVWFPMARIALISGITSALGGFGAIASNVGIAESVEHLGWRPVMGAAGIVGLVITFILYWIVPSSPIWMEKKRKIHLQEHPLRSLWHSMKTVFSNPQTWIIGFVSSCLYLPLPILGELWGVEYIVTVTGAKKVSASIVVSMLFLGWMVGGPICGLLSDFIRRRRMLCLASCIFTVLITVLFAFIEKMTILQANVLFFCIGFVISAQVVTFVANYETNPEHVGGTALAATNVFVMSIGGLFQPLVGKILDWTSSGNTTVHYDAHQYRIALLVLPAMAIVGFIVSFFMKETFKVARKHY